MRADVDAIAQDSGLNRPLILPAVQRQALRAAHAIPPRAYHHFGHLQIVNDMP